MIDFIQKTGRAERNNKNRIFYIFLPKKWKVVDVGLVGELLLDKIKVIQRYLNNLWCRLLLLNIFLNRVQQTYKGKSKLYDWYRELRILIGAKLAAANKSREGDVGILKGVNKYLNFSSTEDLEVGSQLLKQYIRN